VVAVNVVDNGYVHRGDALFAIDESDYRLALAAAQARLQSAQADEAYKRATAARRARLTDLSISAEQQQQTSAEAAVALAAVAQAVSDLKKAELNLARTVVRAPVEGWVTNLSLQEGDYANVGQRAMSVIDAHSFWVDAYLEETTIPRLREGDPALILLMGEPRALRGHVQSLARGIVDADTTSSANGLASVNPVFTWVRLAQRVPVRIELDDVPSGVRLVSGTTAAVQIMPRDGR
jgi:RND family efflux transporter MFP subunit